MRPLHELEPGRVAETGARVQGSIKGFEPVLSTCSGARASKNSCCRCSVTRTLDEGNIQLTIEYHRTTAVQNGECTEDSAADGKSSWGSARSRSCSISDGVAPQIEVQTAVWRRYPQTEWRLLEARQRNHMSTHEVVRMRRGLAVMLAHNLHVAGRRGEWAWEAAC